MKSKMKWAKLWLCDYGLSEDCFAIEWGECFFVLRINESENLKEKLDRWSKLLSSNDILRTDTRHYCISKTLIATFSYREELK